jgi:hypothetical protein
MRFCIQRAGESWRDVVRRVAGREGLDLECLEVFDSHIARGSPEDYAAFVALHEWDCLAPDDYEDGCPDEFPST